MILLTRMCSDVLQHMHVRESGLLFAGSYVSPFLYMGTTLVWPQSSGTSACIRDWLKMQGRSWAISALHSFNTRALRSSGPEALLGLRHSGSFLSPLGSLYIWVWACPFKGMLPAFSRGYTHPNCLLNMSALSLLPVFKIPLSLRQDTPMSLFSSFS